MINVLYTVTGDDDDDDDDGDGTTYSTQCHELRQPEAVWESLSALETVNTREAAFWRWEGTYTIAHEARN